MLSSPSFVMVAPAEETYEKGESTVQLAVTSPPLDDPSAKSDRSSVVTERRKQPIVNP